MVSIGIRMYRASLADIPPAELPQLFSIRRYRPGDGPLWVSVYGCAERHLTIDLTVFRREFRDDEPALRERMLFLMAPGGREIGTATAWYDDKTGDETLGRVHWVAIAPEFQGRGLAKPLLTATLLRLRELGHSRAYLHTAPERTAAVMLYLSYGFRPEIRSDAELEAWRILCDQARPGLKGIVLDAIRAHERRA